MPEPTHDPSFPASASPDSTFYAHLTATYQAANWLGLFALGLTGFVAALYLSLPAARPSLALLMRPPTACCAACLAIGLLAYLKQQRLRRGLALCRACTGLSLAIVWANTQLAWVNQLFGGPEIATCSPLTVGLLSLSALSLFGLTLPQAQWLARALYFACLPLAASCLAILCSYLYQLELRVGTEAVLAIFPLTALTFLMLNLAFFFAYPTNPILRQFFGSHLGSVLARRSLTHAFGAAVTLGFVGIELQRYVGLSLEDATALLLLALLLLFGGVVWQEAQLLNDRSVQAQQALVAERRQRRELDTFFCLGHELLCICNLDGTLHLTNPAFFKILGYTPEDLKNLNILTVVHPDDIAATGKALETLSRGQDITRFTNRWRRTDGSYRWISWNAAAGDDGKCYASGWDITEEHRNTEEKARNAQFEKQLIGIVSHDLRNPVSAIIMSADSIGRLDELSSRAKRSLQRIAGAAQRAERMIHDLLDFTQARLGGGLRIHPAPVNINQVAQQVVDEVGLVHPQRQIQFHPVPQAEVEVDADRIAQVLGNLLTNALRYSPDALPVQLSIAHHGKSVQLDVHNGGDPIPPDLLPRLFKPLHRGIDDPAAQHNATRSVGLGLYIVDQAVKAHGGRISVASTAESGTTFSVVLPQKAAAAKTLSTVAGPQGVC